MALAPETGLADLEDDHRVQEAVMLLRREVRPSNSESRFPWRTQERTGVRAQTLHNVIKSWLG
jgi:hypothetical protein